MKLIEKLGFKMFLLLSFLSLMSCSKDEKKIFSDENLVLGFNIQNVTVDIDNDNNTITINLPPQTSDFVFETIITISDKATLVNIISGEINFENPISFTVRAENGDERNYIASVKLNDGLKNVSFSHKRQNVTYQALIDEVNNVVSVTLPYYLVRDESLIINIDYVGDFTVYPTPGTSMPPNLSKIVLNSNGLVSEYSLNFINTENRLKSFSIPVISFNSTAYDNVQIDSYFTEGIVGTPLVVRTLESTDVSNLKPSIVISENATISPDSTISQNFNSDFEYAVTSQSGKEKQHVVRIIKEKILLVGNNPGSTTLVDGNIHELYYSDSQIKSVQIKNLSDGSTINAKINSDDYDIQSRYSSGISISSTEILKSPDLYVLKIELEDGSIIETYKQYKAK